MNHEQRVNATPVKFLLVCPRSIRHNLPHYPELKMITIDFWPPVSQASTPSVVSLSCSFT